MSFSVLRRSLCASPMLLSLLGCGSSDRGGNGGEGVAGGAGGTSNGTGGAGGTSPGVGGSGTGGSAGAETGGVDAGGAATGGSGGTAPGGAGGATVGGTGGTAGASGGSGGSGGQVSPEGFVHPGILVNAGMLDFVKGKLAQDQEPWKSALSKAQNSKFGKLSYTPHPRAEVECGSYSNPDVGCSDEKNDCVAAYTHALLWFYTGDSAHAEKAIEIMNAWSGAIQGHTNSNAPLQSAWVMETFPRAAEIIRYTYSGWPEAEANRFGQMLRDVYQPLIENGSSANGNWELSMIEGLLNIAVYNDDRVLFDKGLKMWRERVPAYIYLESDGSTPVPPPRGNKTGSALVSYWYGQTTYVNGLSQETCRDLGHTQYGLAAIINAAETAYIQGVDLYAEQADRIRYGLGFHAQYLNGASVPSWLCGGTLNSASAKPMWEIGYNHFANRLGNDMPQTHAVTLSVRPTAADHHMDWETLTHGDSGWAGLE